MDALDLSIEAGELYGFLGPNGAGKTTTIRMMLGLIHPSSGNVDLLGEPMHRRADHDALARVGALIEEPAFYRYLSGRRNLEVFARAGGSGSDSQARISRIDDVMRTVELHEAAGKRVKAYSQGMRQRLGVALALLGAPELLILDEPTNGLDPRGIHEIRELLACLNAAGTTVFLSSHLLAEVEAICDRVGVLSRGRLVAEGPPGRLRGAADRIRVEVDDVARALDVLTRLHGVAVLDDPAVSVPEGIVRSGEIKLRLSDAAGPAGPAGVNAALVSAGVAVRALVPERDTLEDVFLALVGENDVPR